MKQSRRMIALALTVTMALSTVSLASNAKADGAKKYTVIEMREDKWMKVENEGGATLGYSPESGVTLLEVDGYAFKDLDKDGELDIYEDWRVSTADRAADLASKLPVEQATALMLFPAMFSYNADGSDATDDTGGSVMEDIKLGMRSFLNFASSYSPKIQATFMNNAQAVCEATEFGIPMNMSANPTNFGMWQGDNLALAASMDAELTNQVGQAMSKQYRAVGITTLLGPQIDLATDPRWNRIGGTFGEDPALSADLANALISGMQSTYAQDGTDLGWGSESIITQMKHFPGDGMGESGREGHLGSPGQYAVYPGGGFQTSLIPFVDGGLNLDSLTGQTGAVMTSFSIAYDENLLYGELVGTAFSEYKINILRQTYGWDGVICTDWIFGFLAGSMEQGVKDLTITEKIAKCILAGVDQLGGQYDLAQTMEGVEELRDQIGVEAADARIRESARRILKSMMDTGSFENGYLVSSEANDIINDEANLALAETVSHGSIVMLKNADNTIRASEEGTEKQTVYIPMVFTPESKGYMSVTPASWDFPVDRKLADTYYNVITDTVGEPTGTDAEGNPCLTEADIIRASAEELAKCDLALVFASAPSQANGYNSETQTYFPISLQYSDYVANSAGVRSESLSGETISKQVEIPYGVVTEVSKENRSYYGQSDQVTNKSQLDMILYAAENMPESGRVIVSLSTDNPVIVSEFEASVDAILLNFGVDQKYIFEIVSGEVEPSGLLPFQMPANMETVEASNEDVPRDLECYVDSEGNTYDFTFGMNWSGVIKDDRTEKYDVAPLTEPTFVNEAK